MIYTVRFTWDDEAKVWTATSNDVPGLVLESESFDALVDRVKLAAPELLELNKQAVRSRDNRIRIISDSETAMAA